METRRLFVALLAALAVFLIYTRVFNWLYPPPPPPTRPAAPDGPGPSADRQTATGTWPTAPTQPAPGVTSVQTAAADSRFSSGSSAEPLTLGGAPEDALEVTLDPRGAALSFLRLCGRRRPDASSPYLYRADAETNEPYVLLKPLGDGGSRHHSFETPRIRMGEESWTLRDLIWERDVAASGSDARRAVFTTTLREVESGAAILRLTKTYQLRPGSALIDLKLNVKNLSGQSLKVVIEQDGPLGIPKEQLQYNMRRLVWTWRTADGIEADSLQRSKLEGGKPPRKLGAAQAEEPFLWSALANKYFAVFTRPLPVHADSVDYIARVEARLGAPELTDDPGDLLTRIYTVPLELSAGGTAGLAFEIYAGPKDPVILEKINPAFTDRTQLAYVLAKDADQRCFCTFHALTRFMTWLMRSIRAVVRNYGVAIIILVLIIRALLHPLAVFQQKSMFRMQEAMGRLQPKLQAIKERHANDKVRQNQETMKLYAEEGVNPMAGMVSMVPLLIQMPILVALWTALNTDVLLRHAPFDGWWITDLSAPDAAYTFAGEGFTIPILGWLPLIGRMFTNIKSINLLPILMGVSMWLQQKYMPKPHMEAKLKAAREQAAQPKSKSGMTPQDQLRQQQMIAYMMSILFPLMFYRMPSGLNLYWMSTNIFGIIESLVIRKQLKEEKQRRELEGPQPVKKKKAGLMARTLKRIARQAEELQKKADQLSEQDQRKRPGRNDEPKAKKRR